MAVAKRKAKQERVRISERMLAEARAGLVRLKRIAADQRLVNPFKVAQFHPPDVMPKGEKIAMDSVMDLSVWAATQIGTGLSGAISEGMAFMGYPELAVLAQRPEYRVVAEVVATEQT